VETSFCRKKLEAQKKKISKNLLKTFGIPVLVLGDYEMPKGLEGVCIKKHECYDTIEKLYPD